MADIQFAAAMDGGESIEREYQKMIRVNAKLREELTQLATMSRKNFEEDQKGRKLQIADAKSAEAIIAKLMTKEEQHAAAIAKLNRLRKDGHLTADQHARATAAEGAAFAKATGNVESFSEAMKESGREFVKLYAAIAIGKRILQELKQEYDALIARQDRSAGAQITLAKAHDIAIGNLDDSMSADDFRQRMRAMSKAIGRDEAVLTEAAAGALSAKGDKSAAAALDAVRASAAWRPTAGAGEIQQLSGTALDLGKAFRMSPEAALGLLSQTQKLSRVVSAQGMSENVAPAIVSASGFGVGREIAAAVAASISGTRGDPTGAQTGTAMASLFGQLRDFGGPNQTVPQTLAAVQRNPQLRAQFLKDASFEQTMRIPVENLLTPGTQGFREFENAQQQLRAVNPLAVYQRDIANKMSSPAIQAALLSEGLGNAANQQLLRDPGQAMSGIIRQGMETFRRNRGDLGISVQTRQILDDLMTGGTQTPERMVAALQQEEQSLRNPQRNIGPNFGVVANQSGADTRPGDIERAQELREIRNILQRQLDLQQGKAGMDVIQGRRNNQGEAGP